MKRTSTKRSWLRSVVFGAALAIGTAGAAGVAHADETVPQLANKLAKSKDEKTRISAAISLGRLKDPRSLKPLIGSLSDKSNVVRAVAATALGHLKDPRALPALKRASRDKDSTVRKRATQAIARIRSTEAENGEMIVARRKQRDAHYRLSGKETPRIAGKPELYVTIKSTSDDTKGKLKKKTRDARGKALEGFMQNELDGNRRITTHETVAEELSLTHYALDLSIQKLKREVNGAYIEMSCELRLAISDQRGKMISILTGGAKVQVPKRTFRKEFESQMRREALENAVKSVHQDLITYLRKNPS